MPFIYIVPFAVTIKPQIHILLQKYCLKIKGKQCSLILSII